MRANQKICQSHIASHTSVLTFPMQSASEALHNRCKAEFPEGCVALNEARPGEKCDGTPAEWPMSCRGSLALRWGSQGWLAMRHPSASSTHRPRQTAELREPLHPARTTRRRSFMKKKKKKSERVNEVAASLSTSSVGKVRLLWKCNRLQFTLTLYFDRPL